MDKKYVIDLIAKLSDQTTAEMIVARLIEEGLLHLGHGNSDVDTITTAFSEAFGNTKTSRFDRFAANRLSAKYGSRAVCGIISLLGQARGDKYVPVVNSVTELEQKLVSVLAFLRKNKGDEEIMA